MINLPSPRYGFLVAFWLIITVFGGGLFSTALYIIAPGWVPLGIGLTLLLPMVLFVPGMRRKQMIYIVYRLWNGLATRICSIAQVFIMGICFYIVFVAVGRAGSFLLLDKPHSDQSLWFPRETISLKSLKSQGTVSEESLNKQNWVSEIFSWICQTKNFWAVGLIPFFVLLSVFEKNKEAEMPTDIYTLF